MGNQSVRKHQQIAEKQDSIDGIKYEENGI